MELEHELLLRAQTGDAAAFAELVEPHRARLWSVSMRIAGNHHDAEDALQDALVAIWLNLGKFRGESRFSTWIYRITANAALAIVRRRRDIPRDEALLEGQVTSDDTDRLVVRLSLQAALSKLPDAFREALVLREVGDLTYEEIALHQGVGVQTVKSRLHRARLALANVVRGVSSDANR